tara:strand:- start:3008 stop:3241 length:234 start_codon:yes stop_codon:yes gene_type:complete
MSEDKSVTVNFAGTSSLLLVLFVGLKLTGFIDWSWWWVLAPAWGPVAVAGVGAVLAVLVALVIGACGLIFGLWKGDI